MRGIWLGCLLAVAACGQQVADEGPGPGRPDAATTDGPIFPDATPLPALRVDYADPNHGPFVGGTEVTLRGRGFAKGMMVTIGGRLVEAVDLEIIDDHRAVIKTPAGVPGNAPMHVIAGDNETTREDAFLYEPIYLEPAMGSTTGGTYVRLRGLGTAFKATDEITIDGKPLDRVSIINGQELVGYTPGGVAGGADVRVTAENGDELFAQDGFRYEASVTQFYGGFGGGPIDGSVSVNVIDAYTGDGVPLATVVIGDPATSPYHGIADMFGQLTISNPSLRGPIIVTAGHKKYESGALVGFDARDVSIFLTPLPPEPDEIPPSGPFGPGRQPGTISGDVVFGGATGLGTTQWDLVPEPKLEGEIKRTYVFTTTPNIFSATVDPGPGGTIDYEDGQEAWHYVIPVRPTAFAIVAMAGIYDQKTKIFTPYAMGVKRGVLVGPQEQIKDVSINIDIPLDTGIKVVLKDVPDAQAEGPGPNEYRVNAILDLGGEGVIRFPGGRSVFSGGKTTIMTGLAPLAFGISDASYTIAAGAYTAGKSSPYSIRILRGVRDLSRPINVEGFLGTPRFADPPRDGTTTQRHLAIAPYGGGVAPVFWDHRLRRNDNYNPVWRVISRGSITDVPLFDLSILGLPEMTDEELNWTVYGVAVPGGNFDTWNYAQTNSNTWSAYTYDSTDVSFAR